MKFTIEIEPERLTTEEIYFTGNQLTIKPFASKIEGLKLCIKNAGNGQAVSVPIGDTRLLVKEDVSNYGYFWFEHRKADKKYEIRIIID